MMRIGMGVKLAVAGVLLLAAAGGEAQTQTQTQETVVKLFLDRLVGLVDGNGDGKVVRAEFDAARQNHFAAADRNGDGVISKAEFEDLCVAELGVLSRPWTGPVFAAFDRNADQRLSKREVVATADRIFTHADRNNDGTVTKREIRPALAMAQ